MHPWYLSKIAELAEAAGCDVDLAAAASDRHDAGDRGRPRREIGELDVAAEGACALLAHELSSSDDLLDRSADAAYEQALQVKAAAWLTLALLPGLRPDGGDLLRLRIDVNGLVERPHEESLTYQTVGLQLLERLEEHRRGEWVDPQIVAGDIADAHDEALSIVLWYELFGGGTR